MVFYNAANTTPSPQPQLQLDDSPNPNSSLASLPPRIILPSRRSSFSGVEEVEPKGLAPQRSHPNLAASIKSSKKKTASLRRRSLDSELGLDSTDEHTDKPLANEKRNKEFHALFKSVPLDDNLIEDYGCALQKDILLQGRIYISQRHLCFNANIFGWITNLVIAFTDIVEIEKRTTAIFIPNAILISTNQSKHFFASFLSREHAYEQMVTIWRQAQLRASSITINNSLKKSSDDGNTDDDDTDDNISFTDWDEQDHDTNGMKRTHAVDDILALSHPSQLVNNTDNDLQSSQSSLPIPTHTNEEVDAARRRAMSEAGPRPTADAIVQHSADEPLPISTLPKSVTTKESAPLSAPSTVVPDSLPQQQHQQQQKQKHDQTQCNCTETADDHYPNVVMDQVYHCSMETLYNLLCHSGFVKKYLTEVQRSTDVTISPWRKVDDIPLVRDVSYIKYLGGAIGPKSTRCILKEELTHVDLDNSITQQTTTQTPDVPSGSSFCVKTRMCMSWAGQGQVRMLVTVLVPFSKSSWLKSTIERASVDGQINYFRGLDAAIRKYTETRHDETMQPKKHRHGKRKGNDRSKNGTDKRKTADKTKTTPTTTTTNNTTVSSTLGFLPQLANDGIQLVGDLLTVPPTLAQCTVVCLLVMMITNMYIAMKMISMGQQLYSINNNNYNPSLSSSSIRGYQSRLMHSSSPSSSSLASPLEAWRQKHREDVDSLWQWLEQLEENDPWVSSSPRNQQEDSQQPQQHHNGSPSSYQHHFGGNNLPINSNGHRQQRHSSPRRLDQLSRHHIVELENLVQHTEQSIDQIHRTALQQRTKLMEIA
ncbi:hypothetical protein BCR42DRAFT_491458 [Absidia repens]|uniref:VASt domain-containing protein n=1 Tax=Absidia repens TaxID=90262 RepID=A0A1X2IH27_9FUNG|nr:hypothetical protein BCR42DRAFT_491458 [Absidia repens]